MTTITDHGLCYTFNSGKNGTTVHFATQTGESLLLQPQLNEMVLDLVILDLIGPLVEGPFDKGHLFRTWIHNVSYTSGNRMMSVSFSAKSSMIK